MLAYATTDRPNKRWWQTADFDEVSRAATPQCGDRPGVVAACPSNVGVNGELKHRGLTTMKCQLASEARDEATAHKMSELAAK